MLLMPIPKHEMMWKYSVLNKPILKDLYPLVMLNNSISECSMNQIWKLKVPPMVRFFWLKVQWERLPCKMFLLPKNLIKLNHAHCDLCLVILEDMSHVLISCTFAVYYWCQIIKHYLHIYVPWSILGLLDVLSTKHIDAMNKSIIAITAQLLQNALNDRILNHNTNPTSLFIDLLSTITILTIKLGILIGTMVFLICLILAKLKNKMVLGHRRLWMS